MPSYRLAFDHHGQPHFDEEFSGEHPDDALFRRIAAPGSRREWANLVADATTETGRAKAPNDWELLAGAADLDSRFDCDSTRPAPFGFAAEGAA